MAAPSDATVRLHPLLAGEMLSPRGFIERESGRTAMLRGLGFGVAAEERIWLPIPAFLVEHPRAGPLLVDTGFHPSVAVDPRQNMGRFTARFYRFRVRPDQMLTRQLERLGIDPRAVRVVVMTHLHFDHASAMSEFPWATFVFSAAEWQTATAPRGFLRGFRASHFDHAFEYRTVDYGASYVSSYASFGRSVDLFGDGSVRLCFTPGHTLGHQSVLLRLGRGREALLCGDAAYLLRTIRGDAMPLLMADEHRFKVSLQEIRLYDQRHPDAVIVPGHDPETWPRLERVYE